MNSVQFCYAGCKPNAQVQCVAQAMPEHLMTHSWAFGDEVEADAMVCSIPPRPCVFRTRLPPAGAHWRKVPTQCQSLPSSAQACCGMHCIWRFSRAHHSLHDSGFGVLHQPPCVEVPLEQGPFPSDVVASLPQLGAAPPYETFPPWPPAFESGVDVAPWQLDHRRSEAQQKPPPID